MADIFDELQEDLANERWELLWKKYHKHVYGAVSAILLATAGYVAYGNYKKSSLSQMAERYFMAMSFIQSKSDKSLPVLEGIAADSSNIYGTLSRLWAGALLIQRGEGEQAAAVYDAAISDNGGVLNYGRKVESLMKDLTIFKKAYATIDQADPKELASTMESYAQDGNPWRFSAYEILGLLKIKEGNPQEAATYLGKIVNDKDVHPATKQRAEALLATVGKQA
ncbi:MAG: tetratricopeptide repeat protein [Alphaproteobacteria bacterium]